jgi:hypothetical protein
MLHVVLDWQKIYKTVLEKAFFFSFWHFYLFLVPVSKNLKNSPSERWNFFFEIGHMGYQKIENFMLIFKNAKLSQ